MKHVTAVRSARCLLNAVMGFPSALSASALLAMLAASPFSLPDDTRLIVEFSWTLKSSV